jgi:hypothetical protein
MQRDWQKLRELLEPYGDLKPQGISDWNGETELPDEVIEFYQYIGPNDLTVGLGGNPIMIPSLSALATYQVGYRTHGVTKQRIKDWPDHWLVIAVEGANPFIFDCEGSQVLFAMAGAGKWSPSVVATELYTAVSGIAVMANALHSLDDDQIYDDNFNLLPEAYESVLTALAHFLGSREKANAFVEAIHWQL